METLETPNNPRPSEGNSYLRNISLQLYSYTHSKICTHYFHIQYNFAHERAAVHLRSCRGAIARSRS